MRWITFAILLYVCAALQQANLGSLGGDYGFPFLRIEYLPLLAVFYALYAPEETAPLAGLFCGAAFDLLDQKPLGTFTVPLALVAWAVVKIRLSLFRELLISQLIVTVLAVFAFGLLAALERWLMVKLFGFPPLSLAAWSYVARMLPYALYTGFLAPAIFWLLFRLRHLLGFTSKGPRSRAG